MKSLVLLCFSVLLMYGVVLGKECTNSPTQLSSHTLRYELLSSLNGTDMLSHLEMPRGALGKADTGGAWSNLVPRKILREEEEYEWVMMHRNIKKTTKNAGVDGLLNEVSLHDVRLEPNSMHGVAQRTNLEYLLMLDVDRLVWSFRKTALLDTPGDPYGGWEAPDVELRGHFVGHYLSATAQMWASTHNKSLEEKMSAVISALAACQEKIGTGYLSAFPPEQFDRFEAIESVWAPYYTIHKILAGLLDQYTLAGNAQALKMTTWMVDYFNNRVQNVISKYTIRRHWESLNEETGGMNDVLYRLYSVTGDSKHLLLAHLFDKPCFLGLLAVKADDISGFHANTHIPIVIGAQRRYEITGEPLYKEIGMFFMDIVNSSHSYATGGTSVDEFWSDPKRLASTLKTENQESCTTYNMLKVSRHLFRWTKEMAYADYYERALTNGVLSIQRGRDPGVMIYMLPLRRGGSKARSYHGWGSPFNDFWCCYGTGIESFSKLGDSIYFEEKGYHSPALYIIQYISSSLDWKTGQVLLSQNVEPVVSWDNHLHVTITVSSKGKATSASSTLNLRIPSWTKTSGAKASLNGKDLSVPPPGNFLSITKSWASGDEITLELPMSIRTEVINDDRPEYASIHAILYGPYVLAGYSSGDWDIETKSGASLSDLITPVPADYNSHLISLTQELGNARFVLTSTNRSIQMEKYPEPGTDSAVSATFRLISDVKESVKLSRPQDFVGKLVMFEPIDFPGMLITHQGYDEITVASDGDGSLFRLVAGLDGKDGTVSLESDAQNGCFIYSAVDDKSVSSVKLSCISESSDAELKQAASFKLDNGISQYHPISFVAKGVTRSFVLASLLSLRDESYSVYFNIESKW